LVLATGLFGQTTKIAFPAPSPACTLKQRVGLTDIEVTYSRPSARGRKIFGGLVPYGEVWRTGANGATKVTFGTAVKLNGADIPAGSYALYSIPGEAAWTVIIDKDSNLWGAYAYDSKNDLARLQAKPEALGRSVETFTIEFGDLRDESATLNLCWEHTLVPIRLEVSVVEPLVAQIKAAMASTGKKPYAAAAQFYLEHDLDLRQALAWTDSALAEKTAFNVLYLKARILAKMGDKDGAVAAAKRSIELTAKVEGPAREEYTRLNQQLISSLR
jgi:hypothetical protein